MKISGKFWNIKEEEIYVELNLPYIDKDDIDINTSSELFFDGDSPVTIEFEQDDSFETTYKKQCSLNLLTSYYIGPEIFTGDHRDNTITITRNGDCIFLGFLEPLTFTQPYNDLVDLFTINATDYLASLQHYKYAPAVYNLFGKLVYQPVLTEDQYNTAKQYAGNKSFLDIMNSMFDGFISAGGKLYYDNSRLLYNIEDETIFTGSGISNLLLLGDNFEDVWSQDTILDEFLKFYNLKAIQEGNKILFFAPDAFVNSDSVEFININNGSDTITITRLKTTLVNDSFRDSNISLSIEDIYNKITVTADIESQEEVITDPMDDETLTSAFKNDVLYMKQIYIDLGEDSTLTYIKGLSDDYSKNWDEYLDSDFMSGALTTSGVLKHPDMYSVVNWYIQNYLNDNWKIYDLSGNEITCGLTGTITTQLDYAKYIQNNLFGAGIFNIGSEQGSWTTDDTVKNNMDDEKCIIIGVHGCGIYDYKLVPQLKGSYYNGSNIYLTPYGTQPYGNEGQTYCISLEQYNAMLNNLDKLINAGGIIRYSGNVSGGSYSPIDDDTTNYLVFDGKILLTPFFASSYNEYFGQRNDNKKLHRMFFGYQWFRKESKNPASLLLDYLNSRVNTFASIVDKQIRYKAWMKDNKYQINHPQVYTYEDNQYKKVTDSIAEFKKVSDKRVWLDFEDEMFCPPMDDANYKQVMYGRKDKGGETIQDKDQISYLPLIYCLLKAGDKYLYETYGSDGLPEYHWMTISASKSSDQYEMYDNENNLKTGTLYELYGETPAFTLGINPKIGDYLVGDEFDIKNTITHSMNISATGTAIPIKNSDHLGDSIEFKILGLCNPWVTMYNRKHPTAFRHTSYQTSIFPLLAKVDNIFIKSLTCKIYSDNGGSNSTTDNDLVYTSEESTAFTNPKDDITMSFNSGLTSDERNALGVNKAINLSTVVTGVNTEDVDALRWIQYGSAGVHPETTYVNYYYEEFKDPHVLMDCTIDDENHYDFTTIFDYKQLGKKFKVQGLTQNIKDCTITLKGKEVFISGTIIPETSGTIEPETSGTVEPETSGTIDTSGTIEPEISGTIETSGTISGTVTPTETTVFIYTTTNQSFVTPNVTLGEVVSNTYEGTQGTLVISGVLTSLPDNAFYYSAAHNTRYLETIHIPEGITQIGNHCFSEIDTIKEVYLPSTLTYIGRDFNDDSSDNLEVIHFNGTVARWEEISQDFASGWDYELGGLSLILCTDGPIIVE